MSYKHVVHHGLLLTLAVVLCASGLWADSTTDPCNPASACTATCASSPCQVSITRNGNSLSLSYNGTDASTLCAADYSTVKWATASAAPPSTIGLFFSATHYPGTSNVIVGSSVTPASTAVATPSQPLSCYVYSIAVCDATGSCGTLDPHVIITGGMKRKPHKATHHE